MEFIKYLSLRWWLVLTMAPVACKAPPTSSDVDINAYTEDISRYRDTMVDTMALALRRMEEEPEAVNRTEGVRVAAPATHDQTQGINELMDSIASYNSRVPFVEGFTILVYSGTNRDRATLTQRQVEELGYSPKLRYERPNFKVKVGRFTDQLEARRMHLFMKQHFRTAIIVPERIVLGE